jgi:hypothetical protein
MFKYVNTITCLFLIIISVITILVTGCSRSSGVSSIESSISSTSTLNQKTGVTLPSQTFTTSSPGNIIKLKTISFVDQQGTGTEAFKMLIPIDWKSEGGVEWILDNPGMPAVSYIHVWNPRGTEDLSVFPNQAFFWTDNPGTLQLFPEGSKYFGNEVKEIQNPLDAIINIIIPRFRYNVQNLKILRQEEITNVTLPNEVSSQSPLETSTKAGKVRIEYSENGREYEDEIYCVVEATYYPIQSMFGNYNNIFWGVNYIGSFRAEKGQLDNSAKILQTISNSITLNINWFNTYVQMVEYLIKMEIQQIQSIGQLGSIIAQTGSEIRQENLDLYYQREAINDNISTQFSEYVRGVDSYYNPLEGKNVEIPIGYDNVWVNNLGEYVLTDNPNYNPNIGGNQNFQRLEPAK